MARLARFYGLDPLRLPGWYLDILDRAYPLLKAEERLDAIGAARAAWADKNDFTRLVRGLEREAAPYREPKPVQMAQGDDKKMAADFFKKLGARLQD